MEFNEYPKIQTVLKRSQKTYKVLPGEYSKPEFELFKNQDWLFTEKIDGTNIRAIYRKGLKTIEIKGRTDKSEIPASLEKKIKSKLMGKIKSIDTMFLDDVCFYGEGYGHKIQKNGSKYSEDQDFIVFDIMYQGGWLGRDLIVVMCASLSLDFVPIIGSGSLELMIEKTARGFDSVFGDFKAEGIVARLQDEGKRMITKLKHKDF